jgi:hypothetical protein
MREGMNHGNMSGVEPLREFLLGKFVHQEAYRAAVHAVDRLVRIHEPLQRTEHETVAAERHNYVGTFRRHVAIAANEAPARTLRRRCVAGDKGDVLVA